MLLLLPISFLFFFNDTATTEIYTLSLHDALPISQFGHDRSGARVGLTESHCSGGCWFRRYHGGSGGNGSSPTPLFRRDFVNDGGNEQTTTSKNSTLPRARRPNGALHLWENAARLPA